MSVRFETVLEDWKSWLHATAVCFNPRVQHSNYVKPHTDHAIVFAAEPAAGAVPEQAAGCVCVRYEAVLEH